VKAIFWISHAGIVYIYIGYPVAIWIFARLRPRPWRVSPITPSVSIVLPVHNGMALLPRKIKHLLDLDYSNVKEIIIVSDGSTDGTEEYLSRSQHQRVKVIVLKEHCGKAIAVNTGIAAASGEVVLFVDIRPEIAPGAIQHLVSNFADRRVGCVAGNLLLHKEGHDATAAAVCGLYWRYEQWIRKCEADCDSPVGVYGGFYAIRRALASWQPEGMILDDMFQPLSVIRQGYRSVIDSKAIVHDMWPKESSREFHRKVRTLAGNFQLIQLAPWTVTLQNRLVIQLVSHKFARLLVPYLLLLMLVLALILSRSSPIYTLFAVLEVCGLSLAVVGLRFRIPGLDSLLAPLSALLVLNAAAVVGLYKFIFTQGPLWKIWKEADLVEGTSASPRDSKRSKVVSVIDKGQSLNTKEPHRRGA
jgi:glycosyltransferase involved in cell wall biosynthesis